MGAVKDSSGERPLPSSLPGNHGNPSLLSLEDSRQGSKISSPPQLQIHPLPNAGPTASPTNPQTHFLPGLALKLLDSGVFSVMRVIAKIHSVELKEGRSGAKGHKQIIKEWILLKRSWHVMAAKRLCRFSHITKQREALFLFF